MNILSIHSHVAFGHVGNAAAVFPMQRLGAEVWPIHTLQFSNHPGYGGFRGQVFEGAAIAELVTGLAERGVLAACTGMLSGYLGSRAIGQAVLDAAARIKAANPSALFLCDPVLGDAGPGLYVPADLAQFMRERLIEAADILTPNQFELETLTGHPLPRRADVLDAMAALRARGPRIILVTSVRTAETPREAIDLIVGSEASTHLLRTPRLDGHVNGAGDALAALFLVHFLQKREAAGALEAAAASIFGLVRATLAAGSRELRLVEAQEEFVAPSTRFAAERLL